MIDRSSKFHTPKCSGVNINRQSLTMFTSQDMYPMQSADIWIGAKKNGKQSMHGVIALLKVYTNEDTKCSKVPD